MGIMCGVRGHKRTYGETSPLPRAPPTLRGRSHLGRRSALRVSHHALSVGYSRPFALLAPDLASAIAPAQTGRRVPLRRTQGRTGKQGITGKAYSQECSRWILRVHPWGTPPGRISLRPTPQNCVSSLISLLSVVGRDTPKDTPAFLIARRLSWPP